MCTCYLQTIKYVLLLLVLKYLLKTNVNKTKRVVSGRTGERLRSGNEKIEQVEAFGYLDSSVRGDVVRTQEMKARVAVTNEAFN